MRWKEKRKHQPLTLAFSPPLSKSERMNCLTRTAEAPSPAPQPKVELLSPNPTASCPLRVVPRNQTHTALTLSPPRRCPLTTARLPEKVPCPAALPLAHLCLTLLLTSPWSPWRRPGRSRRFQMALTRTWTATARNRTAARTSLPCRKCCRLSLDRMPPRHTKMMVCTVKKKSACLAAV